MQKVTFVLIAGIIIAAVFTLSAVPEPSVTGQATTSVEIKGSFLKENSVTVVVDGPQAVACGPASSPSDHGPALPA